MLPYLDVALEFQDRIDPDFRLPLRQVVVGPGVPFDRNSRSLGAFLASTGYSDTKIIQSHIPFRP